MITIVIGKPGAGKSYDTTSRLVEDLVGRLNRGGELPIVCTNLRLIPENVSAYIRKYAKKKMLKYKLNI